MQIRSLLAAISLSSGLLICGCGDEVTVFGDGASGSGANAAGANGTGGSGANGTGANGTGGSGASGTGANGTGGSGGAVEICEPYNDACTGCASENCPTIWCDCTHNADCIVLFECFSICAEDPSCEQQCFTDHEDGISAALNVSGCAGTTCQGFCSWGNTDYNACSECVFSNCDTEWNACFASPDCYGLWQCFDGCGQLDLTCQQQCYLAFPGGVQALETALQCMLTHCEDPCDY